MVSYETKSVHLCDENKSRKVGPQVHGVSRLHSGGGGLAEGAVVFIYSLMLRNSTQDVHVETRF